MLTRLIPRLYALLGINRLLRIPIVERLYIAVFFAYKRSLEDPFAALTQRRPELFRKGHILDIGANVGYTAAVFSRAVGEGFHVFALEPEPENLARMNRVLARRRVNNVVPVEAAASDKSGEASLLLNPRHPGDHKLSEGGAGPSIRVATMSVDDFVEQRRIGPVAFVKIDVQGAEFLVSRGMERLLGRQERIAVAFEFSTDSSHDLISFYQDRGFTLALLSHDGSVTPLELSRLADAVVGRGYVDLLATRGVF